MGIDVGSAHAKLTVDTADVDAAARRVTGAFDDMQSGMGRALGAFQTAGRVATGALLGVGAAVAGGFGMAMRTAIDMNATLERSKLQFTTLMGNAEEASKHVESLFEFGAKTPFETGPIIDASLKLETFGGQALNTMQNLTLVGDAAAAVNQPIEDVGFWVGRLYANLQAGQPFGEAAARLQEMGIMGPQARTALEELQKSGASGTEVFALFQEQLGSFSGAMALQAGTWDGVISTIKDNIGLLIAGALKPLVDMMQGALARLAEWLQSDAVAAGMERIASTITAVSEAVGQFVEGIASGEDPIGDVANLAWRLATTFGATKEQAVAVFEAVRGFGDKLLELKDRFMALIQPVVDWVQRNVELKDVLITAAGLIAATVIPALVGLAASVAPVVAAVGAAIAIVATLRQAWETDWHGIRTVLTETIQQVVAGMGPLLESLRTFIDERVMPFVREHGPLLIQILGGVAAAFAAFTVISTVVSAIGGLIAAFSAASAGITAAGGVVAALVAILGGPLTIAVAAIAAVVGALAVAWANDWGGIREKTTAAIEAIRGAITAFVAGVQAFWAQHGAAIVATAQQAWGLVRGVVDGVVKQIQLIIAAFRAAFQGDWNQVGELIVELWVNAWETVTNFLRGLWDMVRPWLATLWDRIKTWFVTTDWPALGRQVIQGLINGLNGALSALWDVVTGIAEGIMSRIKQKLGIESPSTVFHEFGRNIVQGLVNGIKDTEQQLYDVLLRVADRLSGIGSGIGQFVSRDLGGRIGGVQSALEATLRGLAPFWSDTVIKNLLGMSPAARADALRALRSDPVFNADPEAARRLQEAIRLADQRNALEDENIEQQRTLLALEEQRSRLDFLKQQFELIKLVKENNLPVNILQGLKLGLDADMGDVLKAMTEAMRQLVDRAEDELQISSPSAVFKRIGQNIDRGLALGLGQGAALAAIRSTLGQMTAGGQFVGPPAQTVYIYGGFQHYGGGEATADPLVNLYYRRS